MGSSRKPVAANPAEVQRLLKVAPPPDDSRQRIAGVRDQLARQRAESSAKLKEAARETASNVLRVVACYVALFSAAVCYYAKGHDREETVFFAFTLAILTVFIWTKTAERKARGRD